MTQRKSRDDDQRRKHRPKGAEQVRERDVDARQVDDDEATLADFAIGKHSLINAALYGSHRDAEEPVAGKVTMMMQVDRDERRLGGRPKLAAKAQVGRSIEENRAILEQALAKAQAAGGGSRIDAEIAKLMSTVLGAAFDNVRIHTGPDAAEAAKLIGARAFTLGSHIFFGDGEYAPGTTAGDRLLRHELTHVVQHARGELAGGSEVEIAAESSAVEVEARAAEDLGRPSPKHAGPAAAPTVIPDHGWQGAIGTVARDTAPAAGGAAAAPPKEWLIKLAGQSLDLAGEFAGAKDNGDGTKTINFNKSLGPVKLTSARYKQNGAKIESATLSASIESGLLKGTQGSLTVDAQGNVSGSINVGINAPGMFVKDISVAFDSTGFTGKATIDPKEFLAKDFPIQSSAIALTVTRSPAGEIEVTASGTAKVTVENGLVAGNATMAIDLKINSTTGVSFTATITGKVDIKGITEADAVIKYDGKNITFDVGSKIKVNLPGIEGTANIDFKAGKLSLDSKDLHFTLPALKPVNFESVRLEKSNLAAKLSLGKAISVPLPGGASLSLDSSTIEIDGANVKGDITGTFNLGNAGGFSATASLAYEKGGSFGGSVTVKGGADVKFGPVEVSIANGSKLTIVKSPTDLQVEGDITGKVKVPGIKAEITAHVIAKSKEPIDIEVDAKVPLKEIKKELGGDLQVKYKRGGGAAQTFSFEATNISYSEKPLHNQVLFSKFVGKLEGKEITGRLDAATGTIIKAGGATITIGGGHVELLAGGKINGELQASAVAGGAAIEAKVGWKDGVFQLSAEAVLDLATLTEGKIIGKVRAKGGTDGTGEFTSEGPVTFSSPALEGVVIEKISGNKNGPHFELDVSAQGAVNKVLAKVPGVGVKLDKLKAKVVYDPGKLKLSGSIKGEAWYPKTGEKQLSGKFELGMDEAGEFTGKLTDLDLEASEYFKSKGGTADLKTGKVNLPNTTFEVPSVAKGTAMADIDLQKGRFHIEADVGMLGALKGVQLAVLVENDKFTVTLKEGAPPIPVGGFATLTVGAGSTVNLANKKELTAHIVGKVDAPGLGKGDFEIDYNKKLSGTAKVHIDPFAMFDAVDIDMKIDEGPKFTTNKPIEVKLAPDYTSMFEASAKVNVTNNKLDVTGKVSQLKNLGKVSTAFEKGGGAEITWDQASKKVTMKASLELGDPAVIPELAAGSKLNFAYDGKDVRLDGTLKPKDYGPVKFSADSHLTASWTSATKQFVVDGKASADIANLCTADFTVAANAGGGEPAAFTLKGKIDATKLAAKIKGISFSSVTADFSVTIGGGKQSDLNFHLHAGINGIPAAGITDITGYLDVNYTAGQGIDGELAVTRAKIGEVIADGKITVAKNKFAMGTLHMKADFPALTIEGTGTIAPGETDDLNTTADLKVTPGGGSALASFVESGNIHVELKKWKLAKAEGVLNLKPPSFLPIEDPKVVISWTPETGISALLTTQFNAPMAKNGEKGTFKAGYQQGKGLFAHIEFPLTVPGFQATTFTGDLDAQGIRAGVTLVPKDAKIIKQAKIEIGYDFKTGLFVQGMLTLAPTETMELDVGVRYDGKGLQVIGIDSKDKDANSDEHEVAGFDKKFPTIPILSVGVATLGLRFSIGVAAGYRMPKIKFKNPQLEGGLDALDKGGMPAFTFGGSIAMGAYVSLALSVEIVGEIQLLIASCSAGIGAEIMARLNLELGADVNGRFAPGEGATLTIDPFVGASLDLIASLIATLYAEVCWFTLVDKKWRLASATFAHIDLPSFRPFKPLGLAFGGPGGTRLTQGLALREDAFEQITEGVKEGGKKTADEEANKDAKEKVQPVLQAFKAAAPQFEQLPEGWQNGMTAAPVHFNAMFPVSEKEWDYYQDNADTAESLNPGLAMNSPAERLAKAVGITARRDAFGAGRLILAWRRAQIAAKGVNPDTGVDVVAEREIVQALIIAKYEVDLAAANEKQRIQDEKYAADTGKQGTDFAKAQGEHTKGAQKKKSEHEAKVNKAQDKFTEAQTQKASAAKQAQADGAPVAPATVEPTPPPKAPPAPPAPKALTAPAPIPVPAPVPLPPPMENLPAVTMPALPADPGVSPSASMAIAPAKKPAKVESPGKKEAPKGGAPDPKPGAAAATATQAAGGGGGSALPGGGGGGGGAAGGGGGMQSMPAPGPAVMAGPDGIISQDRTLIAKEAAVTGKPPTGGKPGGAPAPAAPAAPAPAAAGPAGPAPAGGAPGAAGPAGAPGAPGAPGAAPAAAPAAGGPVDPTVKVVVDAGKTDSTAYQQQLGAQSSKYTGTVTSQNKATEAEKKKLEADAEAAKQKKAQEEAAASAAGAAPGAPAVPAPAATAAAPAAPTPAGPVPAAPPAPGTPAPAAAPDAAALTAADDKIRLALTAIAVQPATLATMAGPDRIALGGKDPAEIRKQLFADWAAFVVGLSALQKTKTDQIDSEEGFETGAKDALVTSFKTKALTNFHTEGKDITAMFSSTARGAFTFKGKRLVQADLDAAVPADGLGRCIGSGAVEGKIKVDVVKPDWLAANVGKPAPTPEVLKAWAMEQIKATPKKIETYADGPALVQYPGWVFPTPDIKTDAVFSEYCDLLALYADWYPQGHIRMTIKREGVVKKVTAGELRKPTVFDGMQSPLWVQRDNRDHNWGKTGGGLREALMQIDWLDVDHDKWVVVQTDAKYKGVLDAANAEDAAKKTGQPSDPANAATIAAHNDKQLADAQATQTAQTAQDAAAKAAVKPETSTHAAGPPPQGWRSQVAATVPSEQVVADDPGHTYHVLKSGKAVATSIESDLDPNTTTQAVSKTGVKPIDEKKAKACEILSKISVARLAAGSPVPGKAQTGASPPLERDTYYVSADDATKMIGALETLAPEVQVRNYKKGYIVRRAGAEWYFERREDAMQAPGAEAAAPAPVVAPETTPGADIGLPAPNASTVEVHGFRGVREVGGKYVKPPKDKPYKPEDLLPKEHADRVNAITQGVPLLWAGHIGVSLDGGAKIWGFTPDRPPDVTKEAFMAGLRANKAFPGLVKDDKYVFDLARKYAESEAWNTEVFIATQLVDAEQKKKIDEQIGAMAANDGKGAGDGHGKKYQFPYPKPEKGSNFEDANTANCAIFPTMVDIPVPEPTGVLEAYMPKLEDWAAAGPIKVGS